MPSPLPLLHTAMPTPCLNTFSHSDAYTCITWKCFLCLFLCGIFFFVPYLLWRQTTPRSRCHRITRMNSTRFSRLWRKQAQKLTQKTVRSSAAILSLVPRRKAISLVPRLSAGPRPRLTKGQSGDETSSQAHGMACSATCATFAHAHNIWKWRPIPRQLLKCPVFE